jgi:hypothetical protein
MMTRQVPAAVILSLLPVLAVLVLVPGCREKVDTQRVYEPAHGFAPDLGGLQALWARQVLQQFAEGVDLDAAGLPVGVAPVAAMVSGTGRLRGTLEPDPADAPLNVMQTYRLRIVAASGGATVKVRLTDIAGGMPLHSHGLPTAPELIERAPGDFGLRGLRFTMPGWWQVMVAVEDGGRFDVLTFDVFVAPG